MAKLLLKDFIAELQQILDESENKELEVQFFEGGTVDVEYEFVEITVFNSGIHIDLES